ncbi:MAG TPA: hypothetical protein VFH97_08050 [Gemmatimonadales bacterium]|nr:hypothetical protein [Gemmatimonadales bacterium]
MTAAVRRLAAVILTLAACAGQAREPVAGEPGFAALVTALSEPGGYFDTDNLISNERSYLHAADALDRHEVRGGAYLGVGPDQNFSYITKIRPAVAFVLDIRRDNLLEHLLFKAGFALAPTRVEYLALLFGRPPPADPGAWTDRPVEALTGWVDATAADSAAATRARRLVDSTVLTFGLSLTVEDRATIARFHRTFIQEGLDLRFETFGRGAVWYYPTWRDLMTERDREGRQTGYLAREDDYAFLRTLQRRDRVVPVVGDFAGPRALAGVGEYLRSRGLAVSAFYTSNVEFYLFRQGSFQTFAAAVARLPRSPRAVMIRSLFLTSFAGGHPAAVPGYVSVQLVQPMERFVHRNYGSYRDLVLDEWVR